MIVLVINMINIGIKMEIKILMKILMMLTRMRIAMMAVSDTLFSQLVEGERKAVFEDCEREKEENKDKIKKLKEEIKQIKNEVGRGVVT